MEVRRFHASEQIVGAKLLLDGVGIPVTANEKDDQTDDAGEDEDRGGEDGEAEAAFHDGAIAGNGCARGDLGRAEGGGEVTANVIVVAEESLPKRMATSPEMVRLGSAVTVPKMTAMSPWTSPWMLTEQKAQATSPTVSPSATSMGEKIATRSLPSPWLPARRNMKTTMAARRSLNMELTSIKKV